MERYVFVYADLEGVPHLAGRLWARVRKNKQGATFEYDEAGLNLCPDTKHSYIVCSAAWTSCWSTVTVKALSSCRF